MIELDSRSSALIATFVAWVWFQKATLFVGSTPGVAR